MLALTSLAASSNSSAWPLHTAISFSIMAIVFSFIAVASCPGGPPRVCKKNGGRSGARRRDGKSVRTSFSLTLLLRRIHYERGDLRFDGSTTHAATIQPPLTSARARKRDGRMG